MLHYLHMVKWLEEEDGEMDEGKSAIFTHAPHGPCYHTNIRMGDNFLA